MTTQYVCPSKLGLFRIVRHGRLWRALHDRIEYGRHPSAEAALAVLRRDWPQARLPASLDDWRQPEAMLAHVPRAPLPRWCLTY